MSRKSTSRCVYNHGEHVIQFLIVFKSTLTMSLIIEGEYLQDGNILVHLVCVCFINPLGTRSPLCWKLCNPDFSLQHYPNPGESKLVQIPDPYN